MNGVILNLVEEAVVDTRGDEAWDALLERAGVEGAWTSLGTYPDEELARLLEAGAELFDVAPEQLARDLGRRAAQGLAQRQPGHFERCGDTLAFLQTLDDVIHREVRLHPEVASSDRFSFAEVAGPVPGGGRAVDVHYRAEHRMCWLAVGMIEAAGIVYGERTEVRHEVCRLDDAPHCTLRVTTRTG